MSYIDSIIFMPYTFLAEFSSVVQNECSSHKRAKQYESCQIFVSCVPGMFALLGILELVNGYELKVQVLIQQFAQMVYFLSVGCVLLDHV